MTARLATSVTQPTTLTETVDLRRGHIHVRGHLTSQGADLLFGTADQLRASGHALVVLDLRGVRAADTAALDALRTFRTDFAASGGRLVIRHEPVGAGDRP